MDSKEFKKLRGKIGKTQKQMAQLLGVSVKAVHSYEQGWRNISPYVERQMFFFISRIKRNPKDRKPCWAIKKCPPENKLKCPAWEFNAGELCWFINGTFCCGDNCEDWTEKMTCCRSCEVFKPFLQS